MSLNNLLVPNVYDLFVHDFDISNQLILENADPVTSNQMTLGINSTTGIVGTLPAAPVSSLSIGNISSTANSQGMDLTSNVLSLHATTATTGGAVTTSNQTMGDGIKTFQKDITAQANLNLSDTSSTNVGVIKWTSNRIHNYPAGAGNIFMGNGAGNFTLTGFANTGLGSAALVGLTTGLRNTVIGANNAPLLSTSSHNTIIGFNNAAILTGGPGANVLIGLQNASSLISNNGNVMIGTGNNCGDSSNAFMIGNTNTYTGANTCIGYGNVGSINNIHIGNAIGSSGDIGTIRIGTGGVQTTCQIVGIYGNSPSSPQMVIIDSAGQLVSQAISAGGVTTMSNIGAAPNADGAVISGSTLTLEPADGTFGGSMTAGPQTLGGPKTWLDTANFSANINMPRTLNPSSTSGILNVNGSRYLHTSGLTGTATNVYLGTNCANIGVSNTSSNCIGIGQATLGNIQNGNSNVAVGSGSGLAITSGSNNTCLGQDAGSTVSPAGQNNIMINNTGAGTDTGITRIGAHGIQTQAYVSGIIGNTASASTSAIVTADTGTSQLATLTYVENAVYTSSNMILDGGATAINAMTIRGVGQSSPWAYPITYCRIGQIIYIKLPAFQVTAKTGTDPADILLASGVPAGLRPTLFDVAQIIPTQDGGNFAAVPFKIMVTVPGQVHFVPSTTSNFTTNFGLQEDVIITYTI